MKYLSYILFVVTLCIVGCTSVPPEIVSESFQNVPTVDATADTVVSGAIKGYLHSVNKSHFVLGQSLRNESDATANRVVGNNGVFATMKVTGFTLGISNADSPAFKKLGYGKVGTEHEALARSYLASLPNFPIDQLGPVSNMAHMEGEGTVDEAFPAQPRLTGYTSSFRRQINGYPVSESFIALEFNADQELITEFIYWPDVSTNVVDAVKRLDPSKGIPTIHHTPSGAQQHFSDVATIEVEPQLPSSHVNNGNRFTKTKTMHLSESGAPVRLPWEIDPPKQLPRIK